MNYRNDTFIFEPNCQIIEYDMKSCNTSICREFNLLPESILNKLDIMPKEKREISFGLIRQKNRELSKIHTEKVDLCVKEFISQNNLNTEDDIVSIKNDAIFVFNKDIRQQKIGSHILFRPKNEYHAYLYLKPFEFYFRNTENEYGSYIDIKGMNDSLIPKHVDGILTLLTEFVEVVERSNFNLNEIHDFCSNIVHHYKMRQLVPDIYKEFTQNTQIGGMYKITYGNSLGRYDVDGYTTYLDNPPLDNDGYITNEVDITYNYINIILPLIKLIIG